MSDVIGRALELFVAPAAERPAAERRAAASAAAPPPDRFLAVLGAGRDALALAAAAALELRRDAGAPTACVAVWSREPGLGAAAAGAATPAAARAAVRLAAHGFTAAARGRLVWLELPEESAPAAAAWERLAGRAAIPVVLALAGARPPELDRVLREQESVAVVLPPDGDPALRELALAGFEALGVTVTISPPLAPALRALALAGLVRVRSGGAPLREPS